MNSSHQEQTQISRRELFVLIGVFCLCLALMNHLYERREHAVGDGLQQKIKSIKTQS